MADDMNRSRELADWKGSIRDRWGEVAVGRVEFVRDGELQVGGKLQVRCQVKLGSIDPSDVSVELYQGQVDSKGSISKGEPVAMECIGAAADDGHHVSARLAQAGLRPERAGRPVSSGFRIARRPPEGHRRVHA